MSADASFQVPADGQWVAVTPVGEQAITHIARSAARTLLVSDFDGTLAPIVDDPKDSRLDPVSREAFTTLGAQLGQIAIVTGREMAVARELGQFEDSPGFERLVLLGQYGQEQWDAATGEVEVPEAPMAVREALSDLESLLVSHDLPAYCSGVVLEDKGRAIGVHTRRAADPERSLEWLSTPVARIAERHQLSLEPGRNVVELRSSRITKGDAIARLVERFHPQVVVMMGDDLGDIPAFEAVQALEEKGITGIRVVAGSTEQPVVAQQADVLCGGPAGVANWLMAVREALESEVDASSD